MGRLWKTIPPFSRSALLVLASSYFFWLAEHTIIFPDRKYRFPLEPLMMIAVCAFMTHLASSFKGLSWKKR
jgi:hypothetical protein